MPGGLWICDTNCARVCMLPFVSYQQGSRFETGRVGVFSTRKNAHMKPIEYSFIRVFIKNNANLKPTDTVLNPFFLSRRVSSVSDSASFIAFVSTMSSGKPSE